MNPFSLSGQVLRIDRRLMTPPALPSPWGWRHPGPGTKREPRTADSKYEADRGLLTGKQRGLHQDV